MTIRLTTLFILFSIYVVAQEGTRSTSENAKGKVMIIPFEPLMYMSEIDKKINEQNKWNFDQIRENFRHQLDIQLATQLKPKTQAVSFYRDSIKMAKDLDYIYKSRTLSYELVDHSKTSAHAKPQKTITNGQLTVEMNTESKFMDAKIANSALLGYLNKKYGSTCFIFINELDIKYDMSAYDITTDTYQREVKVHYTIMDNTQKVISSGVAVSKISPQDTSPKKIVEKSFLPIAEYIAGQVGAIR